MGRGGFLVWLTVVIVIATVVIHERIATGSQLATRDRVQGPGWWPTKGTAPRADYIGTEACVPCHRTQATSQPATSMARTAIRAERSDVVRASKPLTFSTGSHSYKIASDGNQAPLYTVSSGTQSSSARLTWAFGAGKVGQSFLFDRDGTMHEARVSYFDSIGTLAFTPGRAVTAPRDLPEAMARPVDDTELRRCFGCHTTAPTTEGKFDPANAIPGVQATSERTGRPCPVGNSRCASCHMPKYDVPDMHHKFTDHKIQLPQK
jgi:hypothetical protein